VKHIAPELGVEGSQPITRAVAMAVIRKPFAGQFVEDLRPPFEAGAMLGERLMPELVKLLDGPAVSYGKGAIVGVAGEMEHGGACVHPMLGKAMRAAIGGGKAMMIECEGGRGGCSARRAARAQGRFLVISAFRHDDGLSGRRASTRRDPGRVGDSLMADDATIGAGPSQSARWRIPIPVLD
jgi:hypothetical protein